MQFVEKLKALVADKNKSDLARRAGLSATAISDYLLKGYIPRADKALALARALKVPLDWLLDDQQDWPAPAPDEFPLTNVSDADLMGEACRRQRLEALRLRAALDRIERLDWSEVARRILTANGDETAAPELRLLDEVGTSLYRLRQYDTSHAEQFYLNTLPGKDVPWAELKPDRLRARWYEQRDRLAGLAAVQDFMHDAPMRPPNEALANLRQRLKQFDSERRAPAAKAEKRRGK